MIGATQWICEIEGENECAKSKGSYHANIKFNSADLSHYPRYEVTLNNIYMLIYQGIHSDGANIKFEACQLNCSESESEWSNYLCISTQWSCKEVVAENDNAYIKLETCQLRRKSELK